MSIINDLTNIIGILGGIRDNRVANFAYKDAAYSKDQANGTSTYNPANNNNIPSASADTLNTNPTVLSEGFRSQASVLTRMLVNHFFGRVSYNLNKTVDKLTEALTSIKDALGAAEGIAQLDANGKIPDTNLSDTVKTAFSGISQGNDSVTVSRLSGQNAVTFPAMSGASAGSAGKPGLVPKPAQGDNTKFLCGNGTWASTPYPDSVSASSEGLMPRLDGSTEKFMRGDGTWAEPAQSVYTLPPATASELGGVKVGTNLSIDSSGVLSAQDTTYSEASDTSDGLLKQLPGSSQSEYFLRGDNTWALLSNAHVGNATNATNATHASDATNLNSISGTGNIPQSQKVCYYSDLTTRGSNEVRVKSVELVSFGGLCILGLTLDVPSSISSHSSQWTVSVPMGISTYFYPMQAAVAPNLPTRLHFASQYGSYDGRPKDIRWEGTTLTLSFEGNVEAIPSATDFGVYIIGTRFKTGVSI